MGKSQRFSFTDVDFYSIAGLYLMKIYTSGTKYVGKVTMHKRWPSVLIVEDDENLLLVMSSALASVDFNVISASDQESAIESLKRDDIRLVILDWNLKKLNAKRSGAAVLRLCRELDPWLPVVVVSGETDYDLRTDAILAQADSFLAKPFSMTLLEQHARRWINRINRPKEAFDALCEAGPIRFTDLKRQYFEYAVRTLGSVSKASLAIGVNRQTIASSLETVSSVSDETTVAEKDG